MSVDVEALMTEVQRRRQQLLIGGIGTVVLAVGTLFGPFLGSMIVSVTVSGSAWTGGPLVQTGLSESALSTLVGVGSLLVSGPLCLAMLVGSWIWHAQVRAEAQRAGIERPALGIAAPARLVAAPVLVGTALTLLLLPLSWLLPAPDGGDILGSAVAGAAILLPLLGPLTGLLVGWRRGVDGPRTARHARGELTLDEFDEDELTAFPTISRRPRSLVRAELLIEAGRLDEARELLEAYVRTVGVSLHRALLLLARVRRAAGEREAAEEALASAARLVPVDVTPLRLLADVRREAGDEPGALQLEEGIAALRTSLFGMARDRYVAAEAT